MGFNNGSSLEKALTRVVMLGMEELQWSAHWFRVRTSRPVSIPNRPNADWAQIPTETHLNLVESHSITQWYLL